MKKAIVISASSDIGEALCKKWAEDGQSIIGTFRTESKAVENLCKIQRVRMLPCDLLNQREVESACEFISRQSAEWDVLVFAPGVMDPIGAFETIDWAAWENALQINMMRPLQILHRLLPSRNRVDRPTVIFFAGAGTNSSAVNYSAYALSKVSLIKMCELLDAEMPDTRFAIIGPGWVNTKIHQSTLAAGEKAGGNYRRTLEHFQKDRWVPMEKIVDCCDWVISAPIVAVGGRNFSVVFDDWGTKVLEAALKADQDMYKLRRHKNDWNDKS